MLLAKNRKAKYNYEVLDKFLAGIVLKGYEVKAIREGKVDLQGAYIKIKDGEVYVTGMHIGRYSTQSQKYVEEESRRDRKLLVSKNEIKDLRTALENKGQTAVPLALVLRNKMVKLEFATVRGKKKYDKRKSLKKKQQKEDMRKEAKDVLKGV